jgi:hypothetical protein
MSAQAIIAQIKRLETAEREFYALAIDQVRKFESEVIDLNTQDQLFLGKDAANKDIAPPYRPLTIKLKRIKGQPTDRVTLKDTGDFYGGFWLQFGREEFSIENRDSLTRPLQRKYGKAIIGLTGQSLADLRDLICDDFLAALKVTIYD